eukprot:15348683-Ditylum_brightwellii.AAC.1
MTRRSGNIHLWCQVYGHENHCGGGHVSQIHALQLGSEGQSTFSDSWGQPECDNQLHSPLLPPEEEECHHILPYGKRGDSSTYCSSTEDWIFTDVLTKLQIQKIFASLVLGIMA